jgi:hypothetical protein
MSNMEVNFTFAILVILLFILISIGFAPSAKKVLANKAKKLFKPE